MIEPDAEREALRLKLEKLGLAWDRRIIGFAAKGRSARRIADQLGLELKTVQTVLKANGLPHDH